MKTYPDRLYITLADLVEVYRERMTPTEPPIHNDDDIPEESDEEFVEISLDDIAVPALLAATIGANSGSFFMGVHAGLDYKYPYFAVRITGEFIRALLEQYRMLREVPEIEDDDPPES